MAPEAREARPLAPERRNAGPRGSTSCALCASRLAGQSSRRLVAVLLALLASPAVPHRSRPADAQEGSPAVATLRVRLHETLGTANRDLAGVGWNTGDLELLGRLRPPWVRIDAGLDRVSPERGRIETDDLLARIASVRRIGAEPLVILYPMPRWLGEGSLDGCTPGPLNPECKPAYLPPSNPQAWEELISDLVRVVATAPAPARRFEVWNEPDVAVFWHGTRDEFVATALATHRAVAAVAAETGLRLEVGGPASAFAGGFLEAYASAVASALLPLDFVSWHHYGNSPFLGPDGNEALIDEELYRLLAGINPRTTPHDFAAQVEKVRKTLDAALGEARAARADDGGSASAAAPELLVDEWNLSAGGYDRRHDTNEGAAYALGSLIELERAGVDGAAYYRAVSGSDHVGDWGLVAADGTRKPAWWVLATWRRLAGDRVAVEGDDPEDGLWARATRDGRRLDVLLAAFVATGGTAHRVRIETDRPCGATSASVRAIDAASLDFGRATTIPLRGGALELELAPQSATWVELRCDDHRRDLPRLRRRNR